MSTLRRTLIRSANLLFRFCQICGAFVCNQLLKSLAVPLGLRKQHAKKFLVVTFTEFWQYDEERTQVRKKSRI